MKLRGFFVRLGNFWFRVTVEKRTKTGVLRAKCFRKSGCDSKQKFNQFN